MNNNPFSLENKTILVTGASSGIGYSTAIVCQKMGGEVYATGRNKEQLTKLQLMGGGKISSISADLTSAEEIMSLVASVPILDGCVLCAGQGFTVPVKSAKPEKFMKAFTTNFLSASELLRQLYNSKKLKNGSSVVLIASIGGTAEYKPGNSVYGVSKSALNSYMRFAAKEFSLRKIRVNSICPGMVNTPLIHRGVYTDEQLAENEKTYPLGRYGEPEDIAYGAVYLLSEASSWVTGSSLLIDGGITIG